MPRSRRGGKRMGKPGKAYGNRLDLNLNKQLPMQAATGQAYGAAKAQIDAQRAIPLQAPGRAQPVARTGVVSNPIPAGSLGAFDRPSERPDEPVTAGLPIGPGPGPEVLRSPMEDVAHTGPRSLLGVIASMPDASPILRSLAEEINNEPPPSTFIV